MSTRRRRNPPSDRNYEEVAWGLDRAIESVRLIEHLMGEIGIPGLVAVEIENSTGMGQAPGPIVQVSLEASGLVDHLIETRNWLEGITGGD